jgi:hypothetical protein
LSATHEEYREARERVPVLVFQEAGVEPEPRQRAFLDEVEGWATGHFRAGFRTPDELRAAVTRGLHDHELALSAGTVDEQEMLARAHALFPDRRGMLGRGELVLAVTGGPHQQVIRPAELEDEDLTRDLQREALFGSHPVLSAREGTSSKIVGDALFLEQQTASVLVSQAGSVRLVVGLQHSDRARAEMPAIIEEDVTELVSRCIRFVGWVLDRTDPLRRLTDVAVVAGIVGGGYMAWRTRAEHERNPGSGRITSGGGDVVVSLTPARRHRQALTHDADRLAEDLVVLLRRGRA